MMRAIVSTLIALSILLQCAAIIIVAPADQGGLTGDFATRATGAERAFQFNTESEVNDDITANARSQYVTYETALQKSGNGAIRITFPDSLGEDTGSWRTYLRSNSTAWGNSDEFWVQYAVYLPQDHWQFKPTFSSGDGGFKLSIISSRPSFTNNEIVVNNQSYRGFLQGYYRGTPPGGGGIDFVSWDSHLGSVSSPCNASNFRFQPEIDAGIPASPANCDEFAQRYGPIYDYGNGGSPESDPTAFPAQGSDVTTQGDGHPNPNALQSGAWAFPSNRWFTIMFHVSIGTLGTASSTLEVMVADANANAWTTLFSANNVNFGTDNGGFDTIWLTPFDSFRNTNSKGNNTYVLFDELITSTVEIPLPTDHWPLWRQNATEGRWLSWPTQLNDVNPDPAGTASYAGNLGHPAVTSAWNGAVASADSLIIGAAGGDQDYGGSELYVLDTWQDSPTWTMPVGPATTLNLGGSYHNPTAPNPGHNYAHQVFIPAHVTNGNRLVQPARYALFNGVNSTSEMASWQLGAAAWDAQGTFADKPGFVNFEACAAWDSQNELVWWKEANNSSGDGIRSWNPATTTWTSYPNQFVTNWASVNCSIHPIHRAFLIYNGTTVWAYDLDSPAATPVVLTQVGSGPGGAAPGIEFHPPSNAFIVWNGGATLYRLTLESDWRTTETVTWATVVNEPGGVTPTAAQSNGTFGRFRWIERTDTFVAVNATTQNTYAYPAPKGGF